MAPLPRWHGWPRLGPWVDDQVAIAHRVVADSELKHAVEDHPPASGRSPVEPEHELVEVALEMTVINAALMGAEQPPLGQGSNPVHAGQQPAGVLPAGAGGPLAASFVEVAELADSGITLPAVGDDCGPRFNVAGDERVQRGGGPVGDDRHPAPAIPARFLDLDGHADQGFLALSPPARQLRLLTADVGLVHLHGAGQPVPARLLDGNVAYVKMDEFSLAAAADVLAAIVKLGKGRTLHGVVLDLRANGGGDPAADSKLLGAWVHGKAWTYFCNVRGHCTAQYTDDSVPLLHLLLVVLTSRFCASACDAFAATVKDLHLGTLVGTRTAGIVSGPGQAYLLDDGTVLGLPSLHGLMADKEIVDSIGVAPDYEAPLTADALSAGRDPGLAKALNLLR
jgi:hypothetical protein